MAWDWGDQQFMRVRSFSGPLLRELEEVRDYKVYQDIFTYVLGGHEVLKLVVFTYSLQHPKLAPHDPDVYLCD